MQRLDRLPLRTWNPEQVSEWFERIGLEGACKLIKYNKVTGETIESADETFLNDTLGISCQKEQAKLRYELSQVKETSVGDVELYGWGSNQFGQLGLIGANIPTPVRIQIPDISPKDNILRRRTASDYFIRIECGKRNSAIISNQGQVWVCGNYKADKTFKTTLADVLST